MDSVYNSLLNTRRERGGCFFLLLDPDRMDARKVIELSEAAMECGVDAILVGTSFMLHSNFSESIRRIKSVTELPVLIFPGSYTQVTSGADAILFTMLISGRNPQYLIDEQVKGAPMVKEAGIEVIPTGYMLIESGTLTSVQFISNTMPIPRGKPDIACAHALAAQYLGMKMVYLEAGSGAEQTVPVEMVRAVASYVDIPVMVGGGLESVEDCAARVEAGAANIVMGNRFERDSGFHYLRDLTAASHPVEMVTI
ncbi:MAG: geranylgeranylglyceryl/heptaprenylglyceryl phosphate synthase [Candidatus Zixiibacteriota bacterium]|nr:MAG: geranylgeranylglyceryl/heptaprenylglyceryl phosphate synthase [candidate division Zixibacteria bacterium]